MNIPIVSVIISHHLDINKPYLSLCVKSYLATIGIDYEVIVISDADTNPAEYLPANPKLRIVHEKRLKSLASKMDYGVDIMHPESKFVFMSNDDILVNKHSVGLMTEWSHNTGCIINGLCNTDNKAIWLGNMTIQTPAGNIELQNTMTIEDLKGQEDFIIDLLPIPGPRNIWFQDWVPMFATCIPKELWLKVGSLDPNLDFYGNDYDWCQRAKDLKFRCAVDPNAFILHFHHKTLSHVKNDEIIEKCKRYLVEKRKKAMGIN